MTGRIRLAVSGTYSTGKTTTTIALSLLTGIPRTHARTMREILPEVYPGQTLEACSPEQLYVLGIRRYVERAVFENKCTGDYLSDGSSLHEWVYGWGRSIVGIDPGEPLIKRKLRYWASIPVRPVIKNIIDSMGVVVKNHAKKSYDEFIHLPVEFPLVNDGHRPVSESFRSLSDKLLKQVLDELGIPYHEFGGSIEDRLRAIVKHYRFPQVMDVEEAVDKANEQTRKLNAFAREFRATAA